MCQKCGVQGSVFASLNRDKYPDSEHEVCASSPRFPYTQSMEVQIFGLKNSSDTRAAERFFSERRVKTHFVDLNERAISPGEINKFIQKFGLNALLETAGKAYADANLEYLRVTDAGMLERIAQEPRLLRLPLVRSGKHFSVGKAEAQWKAWLEAEKN
jgi:arsenate reductase (glutaredoxin)